MIIFTSICANYAHKARTLAKSVKDNIPDAKFLVCLTEKEKMSQLEYKYFDEVILAKDAWEGNFERFIFKHLIVEASTSVKGQFFRYLFDTYPCENIFIYLDPDCYVYSDFIELRKLLQTRPIILCPHLLHPGNIDMELSSTAHGVYNLGFLAVNRTKEAKSFIDWWAERLYLFCYDDILRGIFTDQKWIDLAPSFFDVEIFKHHGYDFAPWALEGCKITKDKDNYYVNGDPLRFIHFSGYGPTAVMCMDRWLSQDSAIFRDLYADYAIVHDNNDFDSISKSIWSYSLYSSGEKIKDNVKLEYRKNYELMFSIENPFEYRNQFFMARNKKPSKIFQMIKKSLNIIKKDGFVNFLKLCKKRICHSNS